MRNSEDKNETIIADEVWHAVSPLLPRATSDTEPEIKRSVKVYFANWKLNEPLFDGSDRAPLEKFQNDFEDLILSLEEHPELAYKNSKFAIQRRFTDDNPGKGIYEDREFAASLDQLATENLEELEKLLGYHYYGAARLHLLASDKTKRGRPEHRFIGSYLKYLKKIWRDAGPYTLEQMDAVANPKEFIDFLMTIDGCLPSDKRLAHSRKALKKRLERLPTT